MGLHDINFRTLTAIFCVCTLRVQSSHELSGWTLIDKLCHIHDKPSDHSLYKKSLIILSYWNIAKCAVKSKWEICFGTFLI